MIPRRLNSNSRGGESSPSVTLEKGSYRMRAPSNRPHTGPLDFGPPTSRPAPSRHPSAIQYRSILLILILLVSCLGSFGVAYYLFSTRWDIYGPHFRQPTDTIEVIAPPSLPEGRDPRERYLSYLPHSGYHNQRIAFENALTLAALLNRTLLVPPVRLGMEAIRYYNFDSLSRALALSSKEGLKHCARVSPHTFTPPECFNYFQYTYVPWDWLVNLTAVATQTKWIPRWDLTPTWLETHLAILPPDVFSLKDTKPYQYRFLDNETDPSPPNKKYRVYDEIIHIADLAQKPHRLIQIGTLFGTSRLRLVRDANFQLRANIRQCMMFAPRQLQTAVAGIVDALPSVYLGVHLRLGDGGFRTRAEENTRAVWWRLVHQVLHFTISDTITLERALSPRSGDDLLEPPLDFSSPPWSDTQLPATTDAMSLSCQGSLHKTSFLEALNTPIYVATDVKDPAHEPLLALFMKTFPCIFFLENFPHETAMMDGLRNGDDGVPLKRFLLPFMDAMVAAQAWRVVGTEGSTFSRFVEDMLWTTYHGEEVIQRG